MKDKYNQRGVSAKKEDVHKAIQHLDKGLFPKAFCKILPDYTTNDPDYCTIMHADTAGTKTALAYLYWKETGDLNVWKGIVQDAVVMNLDDMACAGAMDNMLLSSTIGRNKNLVTGDVIKSIIEGCSEFIDDLKKQDVNVYLTGGETADVGDIVRTIDVGYTAFTRLKRSDVIDMQVQPGDVIIGLASYGKAKYEKEYNSGIGSNGLTSARHDVLSNHYAQNFPESFDPSLDPEVVFTGTKKLTDPSPVKGLNIGQLLLSPTRTFLPVLRKILQEQRSNINGIVHCTGGGQTKILHFINNLRIVKNNLFDIPPVFKLIQEESGTDWKEMYQTFNMGSRLEIYLPQEFAQQVIDTANSFDIDAQIIGYCEEGEKQVNIISPYGEFIWNE